VIPVPLRAGLTRDDIDDVAHEQGWHLVNIVPSTDRHPAQRLFLAPDRQHTIAVVDDARLGRPHVVVQGPDPGRWEAAIRARLGGEAALRGVVAGA